MTVDPTLIPDDADGYLERAKMREAAEAVHGRETVERASEVHRQYYAELQRHPRPDEARRLLLRDRLIELEQRFGYEVLTGASRITSGSHPIHRHDL